MSITIEKQELVFPGFQGIEPHDLFRFHPEYLNELPNLLAYLRGQIGKNGSKIRLKRLQGDGSVKEKVFNGVVKNIEPNGFTFETENTWGADVEPPMGMFIRFDNILGDVPVLNSTTPIYAFTKSGDDVIAYMEWLKDLQSELSNLVGTEHHVVLFYRYVEENELFRNGNFHVVAEIQKVNQSNLELICHKKMAYISKEDSFVEFFPPRKDIDRFIAPDRYLYKVVVGYSKFQQNLADDN